jgi:NADPH2:quinone reductase
VCPHSIVAGKYNINPTPPFVPGFEVAGEIVALGAGVSDWSVGDRVVSMPGWGGYAQYVCAKAATLVAMPAGVDFVKAAACPVAYATSHLALKEKARLKPGETLLIHGASGGVGLTAVELGYAMGATVVRARFGFRTGFGLVSRGAVRVSEQDSGSGQGYASCPFASGP